MSAWDFRNMIYSLEQIGVLDVIMPFILIFTIVFAVLQKTKILGVDKDKEPRKNFNVVIALVMALAVVIPHVTGRNLYGISVVDIINNALPNVALVAVIIVMILLTIGVFGKSFDIGEGFGGIFVILAFLVIGFIFAASAGLFRYGTLPYWLYFIYDPQFQALVVTLLVFGLIIYFITKEDKPKGKDEKTALDKFRAMLKEP